MKVTRRAFVHQTFVVGPVVMALGMETDRAEAQGPECTLPSPPPATRFIPNEPQVRTRLSAAELAAAGQATKLQQFRDAVGLVRNLPPTNVISWTKQIAQHCINCAPSNNNNIHFNWQFLPWHRAYLYFLERILRKLSNHDDLRLVYWDWENSASRVLPEIYAPSGQPLFWGNRGTLSPPRWPLSNAKVNVQPLLAIPSFQTFGGTATQGQPTPAAFSGPHANVHNNFQPGDMADLQFSPRDPVFYAHHGNIDRLWTSWVKAGHTNPNFGQARVFFFDETKKWRFVLMNDLKDESKLGYKYSTLMTPTTPVNQLRDFALQKTETHFTVPPAATPMLMSDTPKPKYLVITNIRSIDRFGVQITDFGVFAGTPPAVGTEAEKAPGYLGTVSRIRSGEHAHAGPLSASFEVTGKAGALQGDIELTIAPLDDDGKVAAAPTQLVADSIRLVG
jgi:polyphenol oxidase